MSSEGEISLSRATAHIQYFTDDGEEEEETKEESLEDEIDEEEEEESLRDGCRLRRKTWCLGQVLDPRSKWVQEWNRVFLLVCATGLFVDPLFFYALSVSETCMCLFVDGWFAITVTVLRCMTDVLHVWNMWLHLKMIKRSSYSRSNDKRSGSGEEGERNNLRRGSVNARHMAFKYLKAKKGFFFDLFVILPLPQVVLWVAIPSLLEKGSVTLLMTIFLIIFLFQYLPKIVCLLRRMQNLSGYIFGTVWWGIALNMIAYFVASHAAGACWYLLGIQRSAKCLKEQCRGIENCELRLLACKDPIYYGTRSMVGERARLIWAENKQGVHALKALITMIMELINGPFSSSLMIVVSKKYFSRSFGVS